MARPASRSTSVAQFAEAIEHDPGLAAKLLQLAGSAFVGIPFRTSGVAAVVGHLGLDTLCAIIRDGGLATSGCADPKETEEVVMIQRHSVLVARIAHKKGTSPQA